MDIKLILINILYPLSSVIWSVPRAQLHRQPHAVGHFGRDCFPWEKTDKVAALKKYFKPR